MWDVLLKYRSATRSEKGPAPQGVGSERASSHSTRIAQQNRCRRRAKRGGSCYTHPPDEHAIWHSELRRKGASRGAGRESPAPDMCMGKLHVEFFTILQ